MCEGCANPAGGIYITGCKACRVRDIARGPAFFESIKTGQPTEVYKAQLRGIKGVKPTAAHALVVAESARLKSTQGSLI